MKKDISSINEDYRIQKIGWPVQKIFWSLIFCVLIFGVLGGLGDNTGVLSEKTIEVNGAVIKYQRYLRVEKSFETKVILTDAHSGNTTIAFDAEYINRVRIVQVIPEPDAVEINDNHIIYHFNTTRTGTITFFNDPLKMGSYTLELDVNGTKTTLSQYTYF
jgi:hypothetical protein